MVHCIHCSSRCCVYVVTCQSCVSTDAVCRPSAAVQPVCNADHSLTFNATPPSSHKPLDRRKFSGQITSAGESRSVCCCCDAPCDFTDVDKYRVRLGPERTRTPPDPHYRLALPCSP